jgi:hypothetical protein
MAATKVKAKVVPEYRSEPKIGYMCAIDFDWHLGEDISGDMIYPSKAICLEKRPCSKVCGMVRVKVFFDKQIIKENYKQMVGGAKKNAKNKLLAK